MKRVIAYFTLCLLYATLCIGAVAIAHDFWETIEIVVLAFLAVTGFYFLVAVAIEQCELHGFLLLEECTCEPEWVPVSQLPADGWYLVAGYSKKSKSRMVYNCKLDNGKWQGYKNRRVTHWRELPELPMEVK